MVLRAGDVSTGSDPRNTYSILRAGCFHPARLPARAPGAEANPLAMTKQTSIHLARTAGGRETLVFVGCLEGGLPAATESDAHLSTAAARATRRSGWSAKRGQRSEAETDEKRRRLVVLHGLGTAEALDAEAVTRWVRRIAAELGARGASSALIVAPDHPLLASDGGSELFLRQLALIDYRFTTFRSAADSKRTPIKSITVLPPAGAESVFRRARPTAEATASGIRLSCDLSNTPPNVATPAWMAEQARDLAREFGMKSTVLGPKELARRGMGGILSVGGGSTHGPRLARLEWGSGKRTVALVGKGITFDTGGISIKPAASMDEMKYDKSGACTVLGIVRAAAELDLPIRLRAYLPLAENMPDGEAYRPGDIVTCYNGKTVEIRNTDAEGRMILADALTWAAREKPDHLLDFATLTGACAVALGNQGAGLFSTSDSLADGLLEAARDVGEHLWRLPLWPEFLRGMKGVHADLKNAGGRWGGASMAAAFLGEFVEGVEEWAHLDIAGPAYVGNGQAGRKGATGYGVALTLQWLRSLAR